MSFADPQSITIVGGAASLARIGSATNSGLFQSSDGNNRLTISHQYSSTRVRRLVRLDLSKTATDPYNSTLNTKFTMASYLVIDVPSVGYTTADEVTNTSGLLSWLTASTNAKLTQLMGGEN